MTDDTMLRRMVAEFREMPGTRLTIAQAARLWALDRIVAAAALEELERVGSLRRTARETYVLRENAG